MSISWDAKEYRAKVELFHKRVAKFAIRYVPPERRKEFRNLINTEGRLMGETYMAAVSAVVSATEALLNALKDLETHLEERLSKYPEVTLDP